METVPCPEPGPGQLLVEVYAAAITLAELGWDKSWTQAARATRVDRYAHGITRGKGMTGRYLIWTSPPRAVRT